MEDERLRKRCVVENNCGFGHSGIDALTPGVYHPKKKSHLRQRFMNQYQRAVFKNGEFNLEKPNINKFRVSDWFITMVEARWRWTLLNFFMSYTANWMFFGVVYWLIALTHGDLASNHLPNQNETLWTPCVENIYGFTSSFLFSVEVHTTVAYGRRAITLECPQAILAMCLQCIFSSIFQAFMVGILFAKLTRPKARTQTILFSKNAVINMRNDKFCLIFRVGDVRLSRILNIKALLYLIRAHDSDCLDDSQIELKNELDGCDSTFFTPVSVIHIIDEHSPLFNTSAADILCNKLEILLVFEGTIETTGQPVQARTSFTENEILWGHRFIPVLDFNFIKGKYDVDYSKLNETELIDTPLCSAAEYEEMMSSVLSSIQDYDEEDSPSTSG